MAGIIGIILKQNKVESGKYLSPFKAMLKKLLVSDKQLYKYHVDSRFLIGEKDIALAYKQKLVRDLKEKDGSRTTKEYNKKRGYHRKILETGMSPNGKKHFDIEGYKLYAIVSFSFNLGKYYITTKKNCSRQHSQ